MSMPWKYSALAILALLLISYNVWCYMLLSVTMPLSRKMISDIKFCNMSTKNVSNTDITIETNSVEWKVIQNENEDVLNGGRYRPLNCTSEDRVAIIVPYRDREYHLKIFLRHMHPFLKRQQIDYGIFVIEMQARIPFNRGMLMNVGYAEARKEYNYQCFIFHDVDLLPLQDRNKYVCTKYPKHMAVAIDTRNYRLRYKTGFGGVNAFTKDQFEKINGFANIYFGWGREDDDLFQRLVPVFCPG